MSGFLTELTVEPCDKSDAFWITTSPLVYQSDLLAGPASSAITGIVTIPTHFYTDLASIPFGIKWAHREGVLHDYLYRKDSKVSGRPDGYTSFRQANAVFYEAMRSRGKGFFIRWTMFSGVWVGGWLSYHKKMVDWIPFGDAARALDGQPCAPTEPVPVQTEKEKKDEVH